jgi:hypothetical protein
MASATTDIVFGAINPHESCKKILIGHSGAFCQYFNSDEGLFDQITISEMITIGNGSKLKAEMVGKLRKCVLNTMEENLKLNLKMLSLCLTF